MKPTQSILILLSLLFISNCGEKVREEIRERFDNGDKKLLVKYKGEGSKEVVIERITYGSRGDTLFWEKPLEDFYYEKVREEIRERYDNGDKKLLVKYKGEGGDEVVVERITYNESGDTLRLEKPLDKMYMDRLYLNGQIQSESNYKDEKMDGNQISYYENGKKESEVFYKDGELDGKGIGWYENGKKMEEAFFKDGELDGKMINYYENGKKRGEAFFKDGEENGKRIYYYENGQIGREGNYKDGREISSKCWDEDGNECECGEKFWEGCK